MKVYIDNHVIDAPCRFSEEEVIAMGHQAVERAKQGLSIPHDEAKISPSLAAKLNKARKEYAAGETISCHTPEEMNRFFESL